MCGRFSTAFLSPAKLKTYFSLEELASLPTSFNIAPTQQIPVIHHHDHHRTLTTMTWGLIPHWVKTPLPRLHTFNARVETLIQKPTFRDSFKFKRCIIPASGFYEWQRENGCKQPFYIFRKDRMPLAFAGLWDHWTDPDSGEVIESCTIITVPSNDQMVAIHDRMPAILKPEYFSTWLDPQINDAQRLLAILTENHEVLDMYRISSFVNNSRNDGEECIAPA